MSARHDMSPRFEPTWGLSATSEEMSRVGCVIKGSKLSWDVPHRRGTLDSGKHADHRRDVYTSFDNGSRIVAFDHNLAGVSSGSGGGELYFRSARPLMSQRAASLRSSRSHASIRGANRSSDLVRHSPSVAEQCRADWSGDTAPTDKLSTVAVRGSSPVGAAKRFDRGPQDQDQPTCRRHVVKMSSCRTCRLLSRRHIHDMSSMSSRHGRHVFLTCRMSCLLGGPADMSSDDIANIDLE